MHLLVAAHDLYPDPGSGGTGRYVHETGKRLVDRGHRVSVVTRRRGDVPRRERVAGMDVYRYDLAVAERSAPEILPDLASAADRVSTQVAELDAADPVDLVSHQGPVTPHLVDRAVDEAVPRTVTFHSPWPTEYELRTRGEDGRDGLLRAANGALRRRLEGSLLADAERVIALSEFMLGECRDVYGAVPDPTVVPGGVDTGTFAPDRGDGGLAGDPAFLTVRRLSERMGHDLLLRAFAAVRERHPDARLHVAGDGPLRDRLEATAADLGVADATTFHGYVPDERLPGAYADADVFVLPTAELEGFGLATLEALAAGTPVVGTPVGGTVEVLADLEPAVPGPLLVAEAGAAAIAGGMAAWADLSPDERAAAGATCREYVEDGYTWATVADGLADCYRDVR